MGFRFEMEFEFRSSLVYQVHYNKLVDAFV